MMGKVMFDKLTKYLGQGDERKCAGIQIFMEGPNEDIYLQAINEKGGTGKCYIAIPRNKVEEICDLFNQMKEAEKNGNK